jgi:AAA15 family ATPase/GTPase
LENNHLTYFKVENFKKFDSLEVNDIGQFNLIVGDNNVGKTCLLEALMFDVNPNKMISNFWIGLTKRGILFQPIKKPHEINGKIIFDYDFPQGNYFEILKNKIEKRIKFIYKTPEITKNKLLEIIPISVGGNKSFVDSPEFKVPFVNHVISINDESFNVYNYDENILDFPFVSFNSSFLDSDVTDIYENLKTKREKQILINVLKVVNPKIVDIELRENFDDLKSVFLISFDDQDEFVPLNFLGDGFKRIFYIILKTISLQGKRILIDEIEIGIHYSKMKDFWFNIMKVCKELDVQLFATSHSQECTEAFVQAAETSNCENDIRLIKLEESSDKEKIYSSTFKYNQISAGLESNVELRG